MSIHWPELQGDFSFHIEGFCRQVLGVICLFPPPSTEPLTLVPSAWGSQWPPDTSAWASGSCDIKVTFTAFSWSPSLCACVCNYQRHTPLCSVWAELMLVCSHIWRQLLSSCSCWNQFLPCWKQNVCMKLYSYFLTSWLFFRALVHNSDT